MDHSHIREVKEIEIDHLNLRYAHTRVQRSEMVSSLVSSIERFGQIIPVITLKEGPCSFVLMDGYMRVSALKRCGRDTVVAEVWECKEQEALIQVLARSHDRKWDVIEEAALIRELRNQYNLSQSKIASLLGRKQGWVSGRLALYDALSEEVLELIQKGCISTWAATRVIAPIARAIPDHAKRLTENLLKEHISTRDLAEFFRHYHKANRKQRDKMVLEPGLFLKALRAREEDQEARSLKEGLEGRWLRDLKVAGHILGRLLKEVSTVIYKGQNKLDRRTLLAAFEDTKRLFLSLDQEIRRLDSDDITRDQRNHFELASAGGQDPTNQSDSENLQEYGASGPAGTEEKGTSKNFPLRGDHAHHRGLIQVLSG